MRFSRREFVLGTGVSSLGLLAGCGRRPWQAQAPAKVPRVGILNAIPSSAEAFRHGLHELVSFGGSFKRTYALVRRWTAELAEDLTPRGRVPILGTSV